MKKFFITTVSFGALISSFPALAMDEVKDRSLTSRKPLAQPKVDLTLVSQFLLKDLSGRNFLYSPTDKRVAYDEFRADLCSFLVKRNVVATEHEFKLIFENNYVNSENFHQVAPNFQYTTSLFLGAQRL